MSEDGPGAAAPGGATTVLGIDTSTAATAVCVLRSDGERFEHVPEPARLLEPPRHSREVMPLVARLLSAAEVGFGELHSVAVGVGPGAYTGLRIGITTARSLAQARGLPLHPVGSLEALAAGMAGPVRLPLIDARRGELFAALEVAGRERWPPFLTSAEQLVRSLGAARGQGIGAPLAAGDGSIRFRAELEAGSVEVAPDESRLHVVRALHICRLAARAPGLAPEAVLPRYLRGPDATPSR